MMRYEMYIDYTKIAEDLKKTTASKGEKKKGRAGGSSEWYKLPKNAKELQDLIEYRNMNGNIKDIFKACYRRGQKGGTTEEYDTRKMVYYSLRELGRLLGRKDYLTLADEIIGDQSEEKEMS